MAGTKKSPASNDDEVVQTILNLGERLKKSSTGQMTLSDVIGVAELLTSSLNPLLRRIDVTMQRELRGILAKIVSLRTEISKVNANDIATNRIPEVGKELSEVVKATEFATNSIMGAAEAVLEADNMPEKEYKELVAAKMMAIFEACSFQDITGQRVTKVVDTVEVIEERINILCEMMDHQGLGGDEPVLSAKEQDKKDQLLSGPSSNGVDQSAIDAMF